MNIDQSLRIVQFVQEACPAQKFSEYTPDIWTQLLADVAVQDAMTACVELARRQPFIGPSDIRGEVRRIRDARLREQPLEPEVDGTDVRGYLTAVKDHRRAVGDGVAVAPLPVNAANQAEVQKIVGETLAKLPSIPRPDYGHGRARFNADGTPVSGSSAVGAK